MLLKSDVLIGDFSSNSFEMAYMDKPTVAYIPGEMEVRQHLHTYHIDNMKKYKNIMYCKTIDMVFEKLNLVLNSDFRCNFAQEMFNQVDTNNT